MIIRIDIYRYNECIDAQARLKQVGELIDGLESVIEEDVIFDADWDTYIIPAGKLIEKLAEIAGERAKSFIEDA